MNKGGSWTTNSMKGILLAVATASIVLFACGPKKAAAPAYDLSFIDAMIVHHQAAIAMARLADSRALHE